jgi:hypothetical protein
MKNAELFTSEFREAVFFGSLVNKQEMKVRLVLLLADSITGWIYLGQE